MSKLCFCVLDKFTMVLILDSLPWNKLEHKYHTDSNPIWTIIWVGKRLHQILGKTTSQVSEGEVGAIILG